VRIVSSFFTPIYFEESSVQNFIFQDANQLDGFRMLLHHYEQNNDMIDGDFVRIDDGSDAVGAKDYHILQLHGGNLKLLDEKQWQQRVFQKIVDQIEIDFIPICEKIKEIIELNLDGLMVDIADFQLQISYEEFQMSQLQKYIKWDVKKFDEPLTILSRLEFIFHIFTSLTNGKPAIILYHFPENDIDVQEMAIWVQLLREIKCTVICITKSKEWLMNFDLHQVHFIKKSRERFNLAALETELKLLKKPERYYSLSKEQLAISLAYEELIIQNPLLSRELIKFIKSSQF